MELELILDLLKVYGSQAVLVIVLVVGARRLIPKKTQMKLKFMDRILPFICFFFAFLVALLYKEEGQALSEKTLALWAASTSIFRFYKDVLWG